MIFRCTDAHCHPNFGVFTESASEISELFVCVSACFGGDWQRLSDFDLYPIKKAFGLHPDLRISEFDDAELAKDVALNLQLPNMEKYLLHANALGETGLDNSISERVPIEIQREIFYAQLSLADKYSLPVVIHCVDAWGEVFDILQDWTSVPFLGGEQKKFLIHAAKCSSEMGERFLKIGGYFSFGLREMESKKGSQMALRMPAERILVESDGIPKRTVLEKTLEVLGDLRGINAQDLSEVIYKNYLGFFK